MSVAQQSTEKNQDHTHGKYYDCTRKSFNRKVV